VTTFLLVRHATCDPVGRSLAGRAPGVHLNADGRAQARRLAERLATSPIAAVYSSPLERARETAAALAEPAGLAVETHAGLDEMEYGAWTGCTFAALAADERWRRFNTFRSTTRPPGGETMQEAQVRAVAALVALAERHGDAVVAAVSHADVIKAVVAHVAGVPLDLAYRLEVSPASVSVVTLDAEDARLLALNGTGEWACR
jgi:probable phosphomutase (TIGR03848 family)